MTSPNGLRLFLTNAFGLKSKIGEFRHILKQSEADVAIVTETKCTPEKVTDAEASVPGYITPILCDRTAQGGGVAVWLKTGLGFQQLSQINTLHFDMVWLSISLRNKEKVVLCAVYRSGSLPGDDVELLRHLDSSLDIARRHGARVIAAGDFNVHNQSWLNSTKPRKQGNTWRISPTFMV